MGSDKCKKDSRPSRQTARWPCTFAASAVRPWHCDQRRLLRPPPGYPHGDSYVPCFTDRFSRRADKYAVSEFTAEGTAEILMNKYFPLWGCPVCLLSDSGLQFFSNLPHVIYKLYGMRTIATSSYHPNGNGGVEHVNHTMA